MNIVISGAARGIGKAIAEAFAKEGNTIFVCARNEEALQKTAHEIEEKFSTCRVYSMTADLSIKNEADAFAKFCLAIATPDILINNAGSFVPGNILEEQDEALQTMLNNNLFSAYFLTKSLAPAMALQMKGHIFNICSIASLRAYNAGGSYSISKFALNGFSQNLREELKTKGIKVTAVFPGAVLTDSWGDFDNSDNRIMEATDVAAMILAATKLSIAAVPEEIILRPQLGDL